jgi:hypothetical protein
MTRKLKALPIAAAVLAALVGGSVAIAGGPGGHESAGDRHAVSPASIERAEAAERAADAAGHDDDAGEADEHVKDQATFDRARAAALGAAGNGEVTQIERADEGQSGYAVEVRRSGGSYVEVALDRGYGVVSVENDDD